MTTNYIELSNAETGEQKIYEITALEMDYTVRYGRIGTDGQRKYFAFENTTTIQKSVDKTLAEKLKKGYQHATVGQTAKQETQHQVTLDLVKTLFLLICNDNTELAKNCYSGFKQFIEDEENKEEYEDDIEGLIEIRIKESAEWKLIYFVDWKDTESMLDSLDTICANLNLNIIFEWGCENPEDDLDVPQIMLLAHQKLQKIGYALWHWDMGCDDYEGWVAKHQDATKIEGLASQLGMRVGYPN